MPKIDFRNITKSDITNLNIDDPKFEQLGISAFPSFDDDNESERYYKYQDEYMKAHVISAIRTTRYEKNFGLCYRLTKEKLLFRVNKLLI
jgi:hypothetical protein